MTTHFNFTCPHCHKYVDISVTLHGDHGPTQPLSPEQRAEEWRANAPLPIKRFLDDLEFKGVLDPFRRTVSKLRASHRPGNPYRYLFTLLERMHPRQGTPPHVYHVLSRHLGGGRIELWQAQGIVIVTADGYLKAFIDSETLDIPAPAKIGPSSDDWVRTRFGYVTSPLLFSEFKRTALGAWDSLRNTPKGA